MLNKAALMGATMLAHSPVIFAMAVEADERLQALRNEVESLTAERDGIIGAADDAGEDLTEEQLADVARITKEIEAKHKQIAAREMRVASSSSAGRRATPDASLDANGNRRVEPVQPRLGVKGGFKSFGEFAIGVRKAAAGAEPDMRLRAAATTYGNEGTGADGGFAVPPQFRQEIWQKVMGPDNLLTMCDVLTIGGNSITVPKDETTPWQTSGGILAYWESEAAQVSASKPALEMSTTRLAKLMALVPVSDELLEDAPGMDSYLRSKAPAKMVAKINTAIIRGTGVGQPQGILNAGSLVTVSKESGPQTADTVYFANIVKMWARLYAPCRRNAVWLINQDVEPQLDQMAFDPAATSKVPVYLPGNTISVGGYASLKNRPVIPVEACSTIGDLGDIILADLTQYMAITKGTDIRTDVSMHLYFDQGLQAYRFTFRLNGQPWWGSTITPQFGTATRSWAVTLEAR